jgi:hypothetical protein
MNKKKRGGLDMQVDEDTIIGTLVTLDLNSPSWACLIPTGRLEEMYKLSGYLMEVWALSAEWGGGLVLCVRDAVGDHKNLGDVFPDLVKPYQG